MAAKVFCFFSSEKKALLPSLPHTVRGILVPAMTLPCRMVDQRKRPLLFQVFGAPGRPTAASRNGLLVPTFCRYRVRASLWVGINVRRGLGGGSLPSLTLSVTLLISGKVFCFFSSEKNAFLTSRKATSSRVGIRRRLWHTDRRGRPPGRAFQPSISRIDPNPGGQPLERTACRQT